MQKFGPSLPPSLADVGGGGEGHIFAAIIWVRQTKDVSMGKLGGT